LNGNPPHESLEDLKAELAPSLRLGLNRKGEEVNINEEEEEESEPKPRRQRGAVKPRSDGTRKTQKAKESSPDLKLILDKLTSLEDRVGLAERRVGLEEPVEDGHERIAKQPSAKLQLVRDEIDALD
jgi:hypothetical protein